MATKPPTPLPANYYGCGLDEGVTVTAMIGEIECGSSTVGADGCWSIQIRAGTGGAAIEGATVNFMIGGAMAKRSAMWSAGFLPPDVETGIVLDTAPPFIPDLAGGGSLQITTFSGGSLTDLQDALMDKCTSNSVAAYAIANGDWVTFVPASRIAAVNAAFTASVASDGMVPAGTILLISGCS